MCKVCGCNPCRSACPNAEDDVVATCEQCGYDITTSIKSYVDGNGNHFCSEDCFKEYYGFKEYNE